MAVQEEEVLGRLGGGGHGTSCFGEGLRSGGCAGWVDDGIQGSTSEEEVLGRRLGVELLSIRIEEGAGGRAL